MRLAEIEADLRFKLDNLIDDQEIKSKHKETRRDLREKKKHQAWIDKVSEASGLDFDETVNEQLNPTEMNEAMI